VRSLCNFRRVWHAACFCMAVLLLSVPAARADELSRLYGFLLHDPQNVQLNLQYAAAAEKRGQERKALAAYERVLAADPGNKIARERLGVITVGLTPAVTRGRVEIGARYETNARERPRGFGRKDDFAGFARVYVTDERPAFNQVWRSDLDVYADVHADISAIDYWRARAHTGPVFDLGGGTTLHIAPGGGISFLDADYFYAEAALKLTFEQLFGFLDKLEFRGAYRDLDNSFSRSDGVALDVVATESVRGVLTQSDVVVVQPFFRWRDAAGNGMNAAGVPTSFLMGDYIEAGGALMYFFFPFEDVRLGARFTTWYRDYEQNITMSNTAERHDYYIAPEAEVLFRNVICSSCDVRLRYRYEQNFSNDNFQDFVNHAIIASGVRRF